MCVVSSYSLVSSNIIFHVAILSIFCVFHRCIVRLLESLVFNRSIPFIQVWDRQWQLMSYSIHLSTAPGEVIVIILFINSNSRDTASDSIMFLFIFWQLLYPNFKNYSIYSIIVYFNHLRYWKKLGMILLCATETCYVLYSRITSTIDLELSFDSRCS